MDIDVNLLTKQWISGNFRVGPVLKFNIKPHELSTSYQTTAPSFTIMKRGRGVLVADQTTYDLAPGSVVYVSSNVWLKAWNTGEEHFECYRVLHVPERELGKEQEPYKHYELQIGDNPHIFSILDSMCAMSKHSDVQSEFQMKTLFYMLLNEMRIAARNQQVHEHRNMITESIDYMHLHVHEPHSLDSLASRYGLRPKYFADLFYKIAGISPINYVIRYRMNMAEQLLLTTNASIREIGKSVGYTDPYQFSKIFKKHKGIAPSKFRAGSGME